MENPFQSSLNKWNMVDYEKRRSGKGANSKRVYWIQETATMLKKPFLQILGIVKDWPTEWIEDMYLTCSKAEEPSRLWWGLRKKNKPSGIN